MASQNLAGIVTLIATTALGQFEAVTIDAGGTSVSRAGAGDTVFGINQVVAAANERAVVHMLNRPGTFKVTAAGPINAGATLGAAASGRWASGGSGTQLVAMEGAGAAGEVIQACPGRLVVPAASWPPLPSDLAARWDDTSTVITDGSGIVSWTDSVASLVATRVGGSGPTAVTIDGRAAIDFGTTDYLLRTPSSPITGYPFLFTVVVRVDQDGRFAAIGNDSTSTDRSMLDVTSTGIVRGFVNFVNSAITPSPTIVGDGNVHVITLIANSATDKTIYVDGVAGTTNTTSQTPGTWNRVAIGGTVVGGAATEYHDGDVCAVLLHSTSGDASSASDIYAAAAARWSSIP